MPKITVETDGTVTGTKLSVDGKEITKKDKVVGIYLSASSPWRSQNSGDLYKGYASVEFVTVNDDGVAERKSYGSTDTNYAGGIGQKLKANDKVEDTILHFVGQDADVEISKLVDSITAYCEEKGVACPDKDTLLARSKQSLEDKAADLGITLED